MYANVCSYQGEPLVYHYLSIAGFLQKCRIHLQIMVILDTITTARKTKEAVL